MNDRLWVIALALWIWPASLACSAQKVWEAGASIDSESGAYGTSSKASTFYMPFSIRRYFDPGDLELVIPYISVTTQGQVVVLGGVPNGSGRGRQKNQALMSEEKHGGLGDMLLKGRYYAVSEREWWPEIDAVAEIKLPTASRSEGLGTGEFDEGLGLELTKTVLERYVALAEMGYTLIGSPPGEPLNNQWRYSLGGGYYFIPEKLLGSLSYEESRALVNDEPNARDLLLDGYFHFSPTLSFQGGFLIGLSSSASDFGINLGTRVKF